jgi:NAD+ kinase
MLRMSRFARSAGSTDLSWNIESRGATCFLNWKHQPMKILVSKKYNDTRARDAMSTVCSFLKSKGVEVLVDANDPDISIFGDLNPVKCDIASRSVDFVVCLGGDGTVLRTVGWIGECADSETSRVPPVLAFSVGSLGFLASFSFTDHESVLSGILEADSNHPITLRSRIKCEVYQPGQSVPSVTRRVLNECLVARGSHSAFQHLDCEIDGMKIAQFQADGLIVATPSGSSAYSMAAGGPLVAPTVPCLLLTPVAPHALSARPLVLPSTSAIEVHVPKHARARPIVSFDGHHELVLERDSRVRITQSKSHVPFFRLPAGDDSALAGPSADWFVSLRSKLFWAKEVRKASL